MLKRYYSVSSLTSVAICLFFVLISQGVYAQSLPATDSEITQHPRLLLLKGEENAIRQSLENDPSRARINSAILTECDAILTLPPVERKMIGRRLLQASRESLRRVFFLSYACRITGQEKYFVKCEEELLAASGFEDWNPSHFLDVAEMTLAVSIGYDWLYNKLSSGSRDIISKAIIQKGLNPSLDPKYNGWLRASNNWNQVCNAGITFGALAVYEQQPEVSQKLITRAIESVLIPMKKYAPDGNYMEGYSYWAYGTSFNVFLISALEKIYKSDFGLSKQPGFLKTASFYEHLTGPSEMPFNYGDGGGTEGLQPAMFWFAEKLQDPALLYIEKGYLLSSRFHVKSNRLLPAAMLWGREIPVEKITVPSTRLWAGEGENEVAILRSDWNKTGIYVGFKAGTPSVSHAHMDVGSFVMDAEGVRWSADLGMQQYNSLESAGLDIWNMAQNSQRWQVFRYSNPSHSTLTISGHHQNVKGRAKIISRSADPLHVRAVIDMSEVYNEDLVSAQRGIVIADKKYVNVRDEIETGGNECTVRWAMLTPAKVESIKGDQIRLSNKGKHLTMYVTGIEGAVFKTWSTDPPNSYDAPNPGTSLVGFELKVPAHTKKSFNVILVPGDENIKIKNANLRALNEW